MESLLIKQEVGFDDIDPKKFDTGITSVFDEKSKLLTSHGSGSGGYAHYIFCHAARELFNININKVEFKSLRFVLFSNVYHNDNWS